MLDGKRGSHLWIVSAEYGKQFGQIKLDGVPVSDGMATAGDKVLISLTNGELVCFK